jgi:hypothetical protein
MIFRAQQVLDLGLPDYESGCADFSVQFHNGERNF